MEEPWYYRRGGDAYVYMRLESGRHEVVYAVTLDGAVITGEQTVIKYLLGILIVFMIPLIVIVFVFSIRG